MRRLVRIIVFCWLATVLGLTSSAAAQSADTVRDIIVEGTQRIEPGTVISYLLIQKGDPFDSARIDRSLKSLFATGLFADVTLRKEGDTLIISVVENPVINRIAFEGNRGIGDDSLDAEVSLRPRIIYTRIKVQNEKLSSFRKTASIWSLKSPRARKPLSARFVLSATANSAIRGCARLFGPGNPAGTVFSLPTTPLMPIE